MLESWLLAAMLLFAPNRDHTIMASAMTRVVTEQPALFKNDINKQRTAALLVAVSFREGSLLPVVRGDKNKRGDFTSFCAMQIHMPDKAQKTVEGWSGEDLVEDPAKCFTVGLRMLRESVRTCPKHPVAFYAEGRTLATCQSSRAQKISNDRMFLAARLVKEVPWMLDGTTETESSLRSVPPPMHASWLPRAEGL